jgi:hypothetical protein
MSKLSKANSLKLKDEYKWPKETYIGTCIHQAPVTLNREKKQWKPTHFMEQSHGVS